MKDAEDEAFDELAKRQGHWGGGFSAKREAALDKLVQEQERLGLYDPPPQRPWVGLTDEEIKEIVGPYGDTPIKGYTRKLFDRIEAKLKEKNG